MIKFEELIKPNSGKSSTRYVGIVSLYSLIAMAITVLCLRYEIPRNNADILSSIAYTFGAVVIGVFVKTAFEKHPKQNDSEIKSE